MHFLPGFTWPPLHLLEENKPRGVRVDKPVSRWLMPLFISQEKLP